MKIMNKIIILAVCIVAIAFQSDSFAKGTASRGRSVKSVKAAQLEEASEVVEDIASTEREKIEAATLEVAQAEEALKRAMERSMSPVEKAKTVGTFKYELEQAKSQLAKLIEESSEKVKDAEAEESYISQFVSGVRGLGGRARALFSYTQEEQGIAKAIIAECIKQMEAATIIYKFGLQMELSDEVKAQLEKNYTKTMTDFENQIKEQQIITGEKTNWDRIAFWAAVGIAAGAVIGGGAGLAAQKYFGEEEVPAQGPGESKTELAPEDDANLLLQGLIPIEQQQGLQPMPTVSSNQVVTEQRKSENQVKAEASIEKAQARKKASTKKELETDRKINAGKKTFREKKAEERKMAKEREKAAQLSRQAKAGQPA